jgi:hypothetical protein
MIRLGCAAIIVLLFAIPAVAAHYLPWWGVLLAIMAEMFALVNVLPKFLKYIVKRFALRLFLSKSRVLKGAKVKVHDVSLVARPVRRREIAPDPTAAPARTEVTAADGTIITTPVPPEGGPDADTDDENSPKNNRYVLVDFTLTPAARSSRMQFYDPSELLLVPHNAKITLTEDPTEGISAPVHDLTLIDEAGAEIKDFDKLTGPSHLRAVFECPEPLHGRVKFRYYFEAFGDLTLPEEC